jgi:hypothetical protein
MISKEAGPGAAGMAQMIGIPVVGTTGCKFCASFI